MSDIVYETATDKTLHNLRVDLETSLKARGFGILTEVDVPEVMRGKGLEFDKDILILGVCNPNYAKQALSADESIAVMLPCTIALYGSEAGTVVRLAKPTTMTSFFAGADLEELGREVETILIEAISQAGALQGV